MDNPFRIFNRQSGGSPCFHLGKSLEWFFQKLQSCITIQIRHALSTQNNRGSNLINFFS